MKTLIVIITFITLLPGCRSTSSDFEQQNGSGLWASESDVKAEDPRGNLQAEPEDTVIPRHGIPGLVSKSNQTVESYYEDQRGEHRKWEITVVLLAMPGQQDSDWVEFVDQALSKAKGKGARTTITIVVEQTTPPDESQNTRSPIRGRGGSQPPR